VVPDPHLADAIAESFGDLPLALEQALAYIAETSTSPADYLELVRRRMPELLGAGAASNYSRTVATAWSVSFAKIRREAPGARSLLQTYSFLAAEGIPHTLLLNADQQRLTKELRAMAADRLEYNRAVSSLVRYSLVQATGESLTIHRLVQLIARQGLSPGDARRCSAAAVALVRSAFPSDVGSSSSWSRCSQLLPHALAVAEHAQQVGVGLGDSAWLLERIGSYLRVRGDYFRARNAFESAVRILRQQHDFVEPELADVLNKLGMVFRAAGMLIEARETFGQAEQAELASHGPDRLRTAVILDSLGTVHRSLGDLTQARESHERALRIKRSTLGEHHASVAVTLNGLGSVLRESGDLEEARRAHKMALDIREADLGDHHPDVATSLGNLGNVLADLGQLSTARTALARAAATDERALGEENPPLAADLNNLGAVLLESGDLPGGQRALERALAMNERLLGADHPDVAAILNNLAAGWSLQGEHEVARDLLGRAIAIDEAALGPDHRDVATMLANLAETLAILGATASARDARERSRTIMESGARDTGRHPSPTRWIRIDKDIAIAETESEV
jgi:tetratricopeptide (TPR) repeat protein